MVCPNALKADDFSVIVHPVNAPKRFLFVTFGRCLADGLRTVVENHFRIQENDV